MADVVYNTRKQAEESARFTKGTVFALKELKEYLFKTENKINPNGYIVINPLPDWLTQEAKS